MADDNKRNMLLHQKEAPNFQRADNYGKPLFELRGRDGDKIEFMKGNVKAIRDA